ncbi:hypothetical protein LUZ63_009304 [Rhynchospora breviuscula]|uniref:Uncharacterized protein n=1 Tax=Rhynchospora breviuscula TaxID=2022672 RepID=A0A9Q0HNF9_9POAL|nr:hypothetical protein LUZ63_009304 [Rhynchospora breviuscula]
MEPLASVVDRIKGFAESGKQFVQGTVHRIRQPNPNNPVEILKRLQREAFSDIMRLRERQDKVERILLASTAGKSGPFSGTSTNLKAIVNFHGALPLISGQEGNKTLDGEQINTGTDSRFVFRTTVRESDSLVAELVTTRSNIFHGSEVTGSPLLLSKVKYEASIDDSWSLVSVPFGAKFEDFGVAVYPPEGQSLPTISSFRPPLFNKHCNFGAGLKFKTLNFSFSLAELISSLRRPSNSTNKQAVLNTFGQLSIQLAGQTKLTMSGLWQAPNTFSQPIRSRSSQSQPNLDQNQRGSLSFVLDIDEDTKLGGWVEVQNSKLNLTNWAVSLADTPAGELGWVVSVGGKAEGKSNRVQLESFLSFDLGEKAKLQPGVVLMMDANGRNRVPALVFRSSWSM